MYNQGVLKNKTKNTIANKIIVTIIMDTRPQQARGISTVFDIVQGSMKLGWQEISAINDNGIDGFIIDRKSGVDTGNIYYVQVKCGNGYLRKTKKREKKYIEVQLGINYIIEHKKRWFNLPNPVILIYVEDKEKDRKCWWVNLKSKEAYCSENKGLILIEKTQRFGEHSIGEIRKLREFFEIDKNLDTLIVDKTGIINNSFSKTLKKSAKEFYTSWAKSSISNRTHLTLGEVIVSRIGWRHMTRTGRGLANIEQSWTLLGVAKKMINSDSKAYQIRNPNVTNDLQNSKRIIHDYLSIRNKVKFSYRHECVVQVVLKRIREINLISGDIRCRIWFYSVYEPRKHKDNKISNNSFNRSRFSL